MSAPFTPGPWTVSDNHGKRYIEPVGDNEPVAMVCRGHSGAYLSNANLISAAPDLFAALEGVIRVADRATVEFDAARAALAKARGET